MKPKASHLILIGSALLVVILMILIYAESPVLYCNGRGSFSPSHGDLQGKRSLHAESASEVLPLMEGVLKGMQTVMIDISMRNFDAAEEDLKENRIRLDHLESLVVNLDLSDTDIDEFVQHNRQITADLQGIIQNSRKIDSLERVEERCRQENDMAQLQSVIYKRSTLKAEVQDTAEVSANRSNRIGEIGVKYGLSTSGYEQSMKDLGAIVDNLFTNEMPISAQQPNNSLSINIEPEQGGYSNILQISGMLPQEPSVESTVGIYIDSALVATVPAAAGLYQHQYQIDKIRSGTHFIYATTGNQFSEIKNFQVLTCRTNITLDVSTSEGEGVFYAACSGNLTTEEGYPVQGAPVSLSIDGRKVASGITQENGAYRSQIPITEGHHTITAMFSGEEYPLERSESEQRVLDLYSRMSIIRTLFVSVGAVLLSTAGAGWYLRRSRRDLSINGNAVAWDTPIVEEEHALIKERQSPIASTPEDLRAFAKGLYQSDEPRNAITALYRRLLDTIGERYGLANCRTRTPRELLVLFGGLKIAPDLQEFVRRYESIRYGGLIPSDDDQEALVELFVAMLSSHGGEAD
jgi:hypothetical protein